MAIQLENENGAEGCGLVSPFGLDSFVQTMEIFFLKNIIGNHLVKYYLQCDILLVSSSINCVSVVKHHCTVEKSGS